MTQLATLARAERTAKANLARIASRARRDIALIKRRKKDIAGAFYDIGRALIRLKDPAAIRASVTRASPRSARASSTSPCRRPIGSSTSSAT